MKGMRIESGYIQRGQVLRGVQDFETIRTSSTKLRRNAGTSARFKQILQPSMAEGTNHTFQCNIACD